MAQGSTHSLGEQEIFVPGGEGWREGEGNRYEHYMGRHTIYNALQYAPEKLIPKAGLLRLRGASDPARFSAAGCEAKPTIYQEFS